MTTTTSHADVATARYPSPVGTLTLLASADGLCGVLWPRTDAPAEVTLADVPLADVPLADAPAGASSAHLAEAERQLDEYFAGTRTTFELPLDLQGTAFQVSAWRALAEIPYAETRSYAEQAARLGRPSAFRAVGAANGRNPLSIVLPCHRVVGSNGSLTGFAGGLETKSLLLEHERAVAAGQPSPLGTG